MCDVLKSYDSSFWNNMTYLWCIHDVCDVWDSRNKRKESSNNYIYKTSVHVRPLHYQFDKAVRASRKIRGIWFLKQSTFHLEDIISVSRSSRTLSLPIHSIGLFDVAKNGILLSHKIVRSLENWFLGQGRFTVCPSKSRVFWSVTKIIEVGNFVFLQFNPCIRCSWWVHECFIDKFQEIQRKRFSTICGTYQHDIILLLTTIFQTLGDGLCINVQINAVVFQDFLGTHKPFSIAISNIETVLEYLLRISRRDLELRSTIAGAFCIFHFVLTGSLDSFWVLFAMTL